MTKYCTIKIQLHFVLVETRIKNETNEVEKKPLIWLRSRQENDLEGQTNDRYIIILFRCVMSIKG